MKLSISVISLFIAVLTFAGCDNNAGDKTISTAPPAIETVGTPINESEIGVPFYPGAKQNEAISTKVASSMGNVASVNLQSNDSVEKIAAFYREKLKAIAAGDQLIETSENEGQAALLLTNEQSKNSTLVNITKAETGSDINIVVTRGNQ